MASDDPNRQDAARPDAPTSPAAIEAAVARLAPEGAVDEPLPSPNDAPANGEPAAARGPQAPAASVRQSRQGPSPWLALPIGAVAGALAAGAVAYGLVETGSLKLGPTTDLQPLLQRLTALEARQPVDISQPLAHVDTRLTQLDGRVTQFDGRLAKLEAAGQPAADLQRALAATQTEVAGLKQSVQALTAAASQSAGLGPQVAAVSGQVAAVNKRVDEVATAAVSLDRASAAVVVLGALKDAILSGRPFAAELDAARAVFGPSAGSLDPFAQNASQGYAPPAKLAQRLADAARAPGASAAPGAADAASGSSIMDRIVSSAETLVRLKPAETAARPDDAAALDAVVAATRAGDLDLALKQIEALPPATKAKLKDITAEIAARRDAANTASALYQQALAAISGKVP
ncbi:hypothetical protein ABLE91_10450 [Aquabacter sp. CN5-332]|uniref:COG4223 family protein n=1 Tax=Aquabacter sp. CN5-332 TaxID=3156608 RepID=UPI0032B4578C